MLWSLPLLRPRHVVPNTSRLLPQRKPTVQRLLRRGTLLVELDRTSHACTGMRPKTSERGDNAMWKEQSAAVRGADAAVSAAPPAAAALHHCTRTPCQGDRYLVPSHYAEKLRNSALSVGASETAATGDSAATALCSSPSCSSSSSFDGAHVSTAGNADKRSRLPSVDSLAVQQAALREMFNDAERRCIRLRKDRAWLREECRAFHYSHHRAPTMKEVSPFVDVALAPVAALKLAKYLSPHSSAREMVEHSILLQQNVMRSKLVQVGAKTLFRCLRCFHIYAARPRTLLRGKVGHSWLEYEAERVKVGKARELARQPQIRKRKYSVGQRRNELVDDPRCCPACGSEKAQWMMEYVHHNTHG